MPVGCGTWPALWTVHNNPDVEWPGAGEIDIVEVWNNSPLNKMTLHARNNLSGCTQSGYGETGILLANNCSAIDNSGCTVQDQNRLSAGDAFNANGGGVYVLEWSSQFIRIWFFDRQSIPAGITQGKPDPDTFGPPSNEYIEPAANFQSYPNGSCPVDEHFFDHNIIINIEFCGNLAGASWCDSDCASSSDIATCGPNDDSEAYKVRTMERCAEFVATNPKVFIDAYWEFNSIKVYQQSQKPPYIGEWPTSSVEPVYSSWYHPGHGHHQQAVPTIPPGYAWQYNGH